MIKPSVKITEKKSTHKTLKEVLKKANGSYVTIGIHDDAGKYSKGKNPPDVVQVALWNEFGVPKKNIPARSFLRSAIDDNESKINAWRDEAIEGMMTKGWTVSKALDFLGFLIQQLVQNKIKSNVPPPNKKSTADQKQREGVAQTTLINTGLMLRSVAYKKVLK